MDELNSTIQQPTEYNDDDIKTLDWMEHIRRRPGMYIGKLGDGSYADDGIYVLLKEVLDNSIDEYMMGYGKSIEVTIEEGTVAVRDYGRGVPLGKVVDVSSKMNTGAKYDSKAFKKSVGLNGVGIKAVNALSSYFLITSYRDGECKRVEYSKAIVTEESDIQPTGEANGTQVFFVPDREIFKDYHYKDEFIEGLLCLLELGTFHYLQRQAFLFPQWSGGFVEREYDHRASLPDHPPERGGYRGGYHA